MSLLMLEESECIEKILTDYNKNVLVRENYYLWANKKHQDLTDLLKNPKNAQLVYKAVSFVMYLDPVSLADKKLKDETQWGDFSEWDRRNIRESMIEEFDSEGKEKEWVLSELSKNQKKEEK
jgi:hypothetical protein